MQTFLVIPKAQRQKMSRLRVKRIERERTDLSSAEEMVRLFQGKTIIVFFRIIDRVKTHHSMGLSILKSLQARKNESLS